MQKIKLFKVKKETANLKKGKIYIFNGIEKLNNLFFVELAEVFAMFPDRIITKEPVKVITESKQQFFSNLEEVSLEEAKKSIDNTEALLNREIFRR